MTFDLLALGAVALFALWGAFTGFARQVGQAAAGVAAFMLSLPVGTALSGPAAAALKSSLTVGTVAATVGAFVVIYLVVRAVLTAMIKKLLARREEDGSESHAADRGMGFGLGGLKAAAVVWLGVSAATFIEDQLVLNGRRFSFTPRDSQAMRWGRAHNLIELFQFSGGRELALAGKLAADPTAAAKLKDDPDYAALMKDSRFKQLVHGAAWKKALETGDVRALMQNEQLLQLTRDPKLRPHVERLAERATSR